MATPTVPVHALIVTRNAGTSASLRSYFDHVGIAVTATDRIEVPSADHGRFTAIVMFPDEFPTHRATRGVRILARQLPQVWIVVVTRHTARFQELAVSADLRLRLYVFARPVWGWALLDRILQPVPPTTDT